MLRNLIFGFWLLVILIMVYLYFFQPAVFQQIFTYPGPGSPYVNTPMGN